MQISNRNIIRFLSFLSFVIFFCPFFQMCSDKSIKESRFGEKLVISPSTPKKEMDSIKNAFENKKIISGRKKFTFSIYKLVHTTFLKDEFRVNKFIKGLNHIDFYGSLSYLFILINSVILLFYSFSNKLKTAINLSFLNIIFLLLSILFFYLKEGLLEDFNQIKIGYYLFFTNSILIVYFCRKDLKLNK